MSSIDLEIENLIGNHFKNNLIISHIIFYIRKWKCLDAKNKLEIIKPLKNPKKNNLEWVSSIGNQLIKRIEVNVGGITWDILEQDPITNQLMSVPYRDFFSEEEEQEESIIKMVGWK